MNDPNGPLAKATASHWQFEIATEGSSKPIIKNVTAPTERDAKRLAKMMGWNWMSLKEIVKSGKENFAEVPKPNPQVQSHKMKTPTVVPKLAGESPREEIVKNVKSNDSTSERDSSPTPTIFPALAPNTQQMALEEIERSSESDILYSKFMFFNQAVTELPDSILDLRPSQLSYDTINQILNVLVPGVLRCDVRIFLYAFGKEQTSYLQVQALHLWNTESINNPTLRHSKAFVMYCAFQIAEVQYILAGSNNLIDVINKSSTNIIAHSAKLSLKHANLMFQFIFSNNLSGTKPSRWKWW